jgi:hypothetical protein
MINQQATLRKMYDRAARGLDVYPGITPSVKGSAQRHAKAKRAANAGSSRRALKSATVKAVGDLVRDAAPVVKAFGLVKGAKDANDQLRGTDAENEELTATIDKVYAQALKCMQALAARISGLAGYVRQEQADSEHAAAGATGATGEIAPANAKAGALDAATMRRAVQRRKAVDEQLKRAVSPTEWFGGYGRAFLGGPIPAPCTDDPVGDMHKLFAAETAQAK